MSVFVDTGVLYGATDRRDRQHARSARLLRELDDPYPFTTDHVLIETWGLLCSRRGHHQAMRFWRALRETSLSIETVTSMDLQRAEAIAERWLDQEFDIVDCTSIAAMERLGCTRVATFDRDFAIYRYGADRSKAFTILS